MQRRENIFIRNIFGTQNYFAVVTEIFAYPLQSGPSDDDNTNNSGLWTMDYQHHLFSVRGCPLEEMMKHVMTTDLSFFHAFMFRS